MAFTRNRDVQGVLAVDHIALGVEFFGGNHAHTGSEHQAGRGLGVRAGLAAGLADVLVQQVFENRAVALEAGRVDVGQVVRNDVHTRLLRVETGFGYPH